jgi:glycine oxidase
MVDVVVIGGGVIGLSSAWELARQGLSVRVLDQSQPAQEASWAGAGMLPPGGPCPPFDLKGRLRSASAKLWPGWVEQLQQETRIDPGYVRCGSLEVRPADQQPSLADEIKRWRTEQIEVEPLSATELLQRFPAIAAGELTGYWLADYAQVRNPRLLKSLVAACTQSGVRLSPGTPALDFEVSSGKILGVLTPTETVRGNHFVVATGAWSDLLLRRLHQTFQIQPVRGQIVQLEQTPLPVNCLVQAGSRYVVPRPDGRILIGATEEHAGFEKLNTAVAIQELLEFGQQLIPALRQARFLRCWSGLRPHRATGLPMIGPAIDYSNLLIAAGHFRDGLQLSPITARLIRELILGQTTTLDLTDLHGKPG